MNTNFVSIATDLVPQFWRGLELAYRADRKTDLARDPENERGILFPFLCYEDLSALQILVRLRRFRCGSRVAEQGKQLKEAEEQ